MIDLLEVWERAQNGPRVKEKEWNMGLYKKLNEITDKHDIERKRDEFVNTDDDLLDRVFKASIEFIADYGVYCRDLHRVVEFSEDEVFDAVREAPAKIKVGQGNESSTITHKEMEDSKKRNVCAGHHAPFSLDIAPLVTKNFAEHPRADYMEGFNFPEIEGREITTPGDEAYAQIRGIEAMRDGVGRAGKPGLPIALYPIHTRPTTMIAPLDLERGLRRTDGALVSPTPDFKVESGFITTAIIYNQYGMDLRINGCEGMYGGTYVGTPENAVINSVANTIISWMCYRDTLHNGAVEHTDQLGGKRAHVMKEGSWASTTATQTISRHTNFIVFPSHGFSNEIGTEDSLKEIAVNTVHNTICGGNVWIVARYVAEINCRQTPLEMKFAIEVSDAVINSSTRRNEVEELIGDWEKELNNAETPSDEGTTILDIYDLKKGRPKEKYKEKYETIKSELEERGLSF